MRLLLRKLVELKKLCGSQYMAMTLGGGVCSCLSLSSHIYEKNPVCISTHSFLPWPTPAGLNISLSTCAVLELSRILLLASLQLLMLGTVSLGVAFD